MSRLESAKRNQSGHSIHLALAWRSLSAARPNIPDMSCRDSKRARHRQRQAAYEARVRDGIGLFPTPLGASELDVLISLNYLPEGAEADRTLVGEAVAAAIRSLRHG